MSAFEHVIAREVIADTLQSHALVHLWWAWQGPPAPCLGVYLDGELRQVIPARLISAAWLHVDRALGRVLTLQPAETIDALPPRLQNEQSATIHVHVMRELRWPVDSRVRLTSDSQTLASQPMWNDHTPRSGFGAVFGEGGFGWDDAVGEGLGRGDLGHGPLGIDGRAWRWRGSRYPDQTISAAIHDQHGRLLAKKEHMSGMTKPINGPQRLTFDETWQLRWQA